MIKVAVTEGAAKENKMILSLHTLNKLGIMQESFPNINIDKFAEDEPSFSYTNLAVGEEINAVRQENMSEKEKELDDMRTRWIKSYPYVFADTLSG